MLSFWIKILDLGRSLSLRMSFFSLRLLPKPKICIYMLYRKRQKFAGQKFEIKKFVVKNFPHKCFQRQVSQKETILVSQETFDM